jgi:tetratricopeptide (TPR) repeat protein
MAVLGGATLAPTPAISQRQQAPVSEFSKEERAALLALSTAIETKNYTAAASALNTAQSAARTGNARYLVSALQLRLGLETNNIGLQGSAIDAMISSGAAPASDLPQLYRSQAALLQRNGKLDRAEAAFARYAELAPNDPEALIALSQVKNDRKKPQEAVPLVMRAIEMRRASGQAVPESWYRRGIHLALASKMAPQSLALSRDLAAAHPSPQNWRDALLIYRDVAAPDPTATIDAWRLMRSAKALAGERDYLQFAQALDAAGNPAEAKAVLDEGVSARMVDPAKGTFKELIASTSKGAAAGRSGLSARQTAAMAAATGTEALSVGDASFGAGDYAKAATLYRTAAQKGAVDPNLANTRLGIALALAGQRGEAEAAFRTVTGPRANLASLWLAWLAQRA